MEKFANRGRLEDERMLTVRGSYVSARNIGIPDC